MIASEKFSVFEYMYRDAGNWKTHAMLLLSGFDEASDDKVRQCLEWDGQFVAEQVGLPTLYDRHWQEIGSGSSDLDHAFHEFVCIRRANDNDVQSMTVTADLPSLLRRFGAASGCWDVRLSPVHNF